MYMHVMTGEEIKKWHEEVDDWWRSLNDQERGNIHHFLKDWRLKKYEDIR